jgi:hypothetical protein
LKNKVFNSKEIHEKLKLLWENSESLDRGQFSHYESFSRNFFLLDSERAVLLQCAISICSFRNVRCDEIDFEDLTLNLVWINISPTVENSYKKWVNAKKGVVAKALKSKAKSNKPTKTIKKKKKPVKSNPPNPEVVIQPEETDEIINIVDFDIRDCDDGSCVDEPEVTEDVAVLAKPKDKDLSKSEVVSLVCLNLEITSEYAIQIYNYRVLKKVSNSEKSIEKFCNEIDANVKKYKKPKILFLKNYVAGTWLEFIKTLEGANDDLVVTNTGVLVPNANGSLESSVSVDNKAVSLIHEHLKINEDLAEELYKHWISVKIRTSEMSILSNCIEINNASDMAERNTQEVVRYILRNQYKSFSASWFVNYVVEENEAMKAKSEFDEGKPNESLQLFLSNVDDLHMAKAQIKRKKERNEKLTKEEDDFLNNHRSLVEKEEREYAERGNPGYASDAERAIIFREKIGKKNE